jgi:hypothetical protein
VTGRDTASRANALRGGGNGSRLGILVRIVPLNVDIQAAFTTGAPVTWGGGWGLSLPDGAACRSGRLLGNHGPSLG